jgi:beta-N-acetylhexosaminidase
MERGASEITLTQNLHLDDDRRRSILGRAEEADVVIVTAHMRTVSHRARVALSESQINLVHDLLRQDSSMVVVVLGSPYVACAMPELPCLVLTYDASPLMAGLIAPGMTGEFPLIGRLPVTLPGLAERGHGLQIPNTE